MATVAVKNFLHSLGFIYPIKKFRSRI